MSLRFVESREGAVLIALDFLHEPCIEKSAKIVNHYLRARLERAVAA